MNTKQQSAEAYSYDQARHGVSTVRQSADVIAPLLTRKFGPRSVVDFGCGVGDWLAAFAAAGVPDALGLDGSWVPLENLQIPQSSFQLADVTRPIILPRRFDLAICLEVAEHIPEASAGCLLDSLAAAADLVVFSAAIPGQGGYEHVNERFQQDWVERFTARGYQAFDLVRPEIWTDPRVSVWYRQNLLVFARAEAVIRHSLRPAPFVASLVHPEIYLAKLDPRSWSLRQIGKHLGWYLSRSISARFRRIR